MPIQANRLFRNNFVNNAVAISDIKEVSLNFINISKFASLLRLKLHNREINEKLNRKIFLKINNTKIRRSKTVIFVIITENRKA